VPNVNVDFSKLDQAIPPHFYDLIFDQSRYLCLKGGAGSSKSWTVARKLVYRLVTEPGHRFLIMRKVFKTIHHSVWSLIMATIATYGLSDYFVENRSLNTITFTPNGNTFIFQALANKDDSEKLKSIEGITGVWMEEATEFSPSDFMQIDLRLRGQCDYYRQLILSFNPVSHLSWIKKTFYDSDKIPANKIRLHESTYRNNPYLDQEYIDTLENLINVDAQYYNIYTLNLWGVLQGLIYSMPKMLEEFPDEFEQSVLGLDFGYSHPMSLTRLGIIDKDVFIDELFYETQHTVEDLITRLPGLGVLKTDIMYCDSAQPADIERLKRAGYNAKPSMKGAGSVQSGIDLVRSFNLHTKETNVNINNEFGLYKYQEDANGNCKEDPVKDNDHAMDGIRYPLFTMFGKVQKKFWIV